MKRGVSGNNFEDCSVGLIECGPDYRLEGGERQPYGDAMVSEEVAPAEGRGRAKALQQKCESWACSPVPSLPFPLPLPPPHTHPLLLVPSALRRASLRS